MRHFCFLVAGPGDFMGGFRGHSHALDFVEVGGHKDTWQTARNGNRRR
jgi:hypothetical protein